MLLLLGARSTTALFVPGQRTLNCNTFVVGMETNRRGAVMMRSRRAAPAALALAVCLAILAVGCAPGQAPPSSADPAATASAASPAHYRRPGPQANGVSSGPIARIGAALSLSGSARMFGSTQRSAIKLAQDEINASRMLGKTRLEVIVDDDGSERGQASAVHSLNVSFNASLRTVMCWRSSVRRSRTPP